MTTYNFSALAANQHLAFNPVGDMLQFDATVTASAVRLLQSGANLSVS
jgi:hypothetical protein